MVNLNRQIAVARARQGGFSARVLPAPVGYQASIGDWGMGFVRIDNALSGEPRTLYSVTGDGDTANETSFEAPPGFAPSVRGAIPVPVSGDRFIIAFSGIQRTGTGTNGSTSQIFQVADSYAGGGDIVNYPGVLKTAFFVTAETIDTIQVSQGLADQIAAQLPYPTIPADPPFPYPGHIAGPALVYLNDPETWAGDFGAFAGSGAAFSPSWATLDPSNPATWNITAPAVAQYTDFIEGGFVRMKNHETDEPLGSSYPTSAMLAGWVDYSDGRYRPVVSLPFGKNWTADLAALGVTV